MTTTEPVAPDAPETELPAQTDATEAKAPVPETAAETVTRVHKLVAACMSPRLSGTLAAETADTLCNSVRAQLNQMSINHIYNIVDGVCRELGIHDTVAALGITDPAEVVVFIRSFLNSKLPLPDEAIRLVAKGAANGAAIAGRPGMMANAIVRYASFSYIQSVMRRD
mgnify:CR=1 FL=1